MKTIFFFKEKGIGVNHTGPVLTKLNHLTFSQ